MGHSRRNSKARYSYNGNRSAPYPPAPKLRAAGDTMRALEPVTS
jgi:hypothetical protein